MSENISKRIRKLRTMLGLSQSEFGEKIGKTARAIQNYEYNERTIDKTTAMLMTTVFGVNLEWLSTGEGGIFIKEDLKEGECMLPVYDAYASAGYGAWQNGEALTGYYKMPEDVVRKDWHANAANIIMMYVKGNSMMPLLLDKDLIAIDTSRREAKKGLYVCRVDNSLYIKNVSFQADVVVLTSENPDYEPIISVYDNFELIGKVIWFGRSLIDNV